MALIKYPRPSILCAVLTLFIWSGTATPSHADTGTLRVVFGKAGLVASVGHGEGTLTFHGKHYDFLVVGGSIGATLALSTSGLRGTALNISAPLVISPGPISAPAVALPLRWVSPA